MVFNKQKVKISEFQRRLVFAFLMSFITSSIVSLIVLTVNKVESKLFFKLWFKSIFIGWPTVFILILIFVPLLNKLINFWFEIKTKF